MIDYAEDDRRLHSGAVLPPLRHDHGELACESHGATMVIPGARVRFCCDAAGGGGRTVCVSLYGVPTMFIAILGEPLLDGLDLTSSRSGIMVGLRDRSRR